jgi:hypothetical protein
VRSIVGKLLGVTALAAALTLSAATGSAGAAEWASNMKTQRLAAYPTSGMDRAVVERRIYLAEGNYLWHHTPNDGCRRDIYLGAGWYTWRDILVPDGGPFSQEKYGFYHHYAMLDPDNPNWETAERYCKWTFNDDWTVTWGSVLGPYF